MPEIPPYEQATNTPETDRSKVPGTPQKEERARLPMVPIQIHDPEYEYVPVSHSPTPARTKPFLPARRDPQPGPERTPVSIVHEVTPVQPPPYSRQPVAKTIRQPENSPKNSGKNSGRPEFRMNFVPENSQKPTTPLQPKFTTKLYEKPTERKKRGRQRAKDRNSAADGVRQLFELWWRKGNGRVNFSQFYRNHLSDDMRSYYVKEYIYGRNAKSHEEYKHWRAEWEASKTA